MNVVTEEPRKAKKLIVPLNEIEIDGSTQGRVRIDQATVDEYVKAMDKGAKFPPVDLFIDGLTNWVGDGFHRILAAATLGKPSITANVRPGGQSAALVWALGANAEHGLKRTAEDKRKAVEVALKEFPNESDRAIARMCKVSPTTVGNVKAANNVTVQMDTNDNTAPAEAVAMVCSWSSPWVDVQTMPTANELKDGVDYKNVGTWGRLIQGRGVPTKTVSIAIDADVPPGKEDCRGKEFTLVERQVAIDAIQTTEPPLDIFRLKPVSSGHTERIDKAEEQKERLINVEEAMHDFNQALNKLQTPREHLEFLYKLLTSTAHPASKEIASGLLCLPFNETPGPQLTENKLTFISFLALAGGELRNKDLENCSIYLEACKILNAPIYEPISKKSIS